LNGKWPAEDFAKLADSLNNRLGSTAVFVPFHLKHDLPFAAVVVNSMRTKAKLVQWDDFRELYTVIGESDLVISQRLHGLILAALNGIPLIGISDDQKIGRFLRELGQKNIRSINEVDHYSLVAVILDLWEWREDFRKKASLLLPAFRTRAQRIPEVLFEEVK
jgi:polysaccharide pyruvyl transferase WcaK-like protein